MLRLLGGGKKRKKKVYTTPKKNKHKKKKVKLAALRYYKVCLLLFFSKEEPYSIFFTSDSIKKCDESEFLFEIDLVFPNHCSVGRSGNSQVQK